MADGIPVQSGEKLFISSIEVQKLNRLRKNERVYIIVSRRKDGLNKFGYTVKGASCLYLEGEKKVSKKFLIIHQDQKLENAEFFTSPRRSSRSQKSKSARELLGLPSKAISSKASKQNEGSQLSILVEFTDIFHDQKVEEPMEVDRALLDIATNDSDSISDKNHTKKANKSGKNVVSAECSEACERNPGGPEIEIKLKEMESLKSATNDNVVSGKTTAVLLKGNTYPEKNDTEDNSPDKARSEDSDHHDFGSVKSTDVEWKTKHKDKLADEYSGDMVDKFGSVKVVKKSIHSEVSPSSSSSLKAQITSGLVPTVTYNKNVVVINLKPKQQKGVASNVGILKTHRGQFKTSTSEQEVDQSRNKEPGQAKDDLQGVHQKPGTCIIMKRNNSSGDSLPNRDTEGLVAPTTIKKIPQIRIIKPGASNVLRNDEPQKPIIISGIDKSQHSGNIVLNNSNEDRQDSTDTNINVKTIESVTLHSLRPIRPKPGSTTPGTLSMDEFWKCKETQPNQECSMDILASKIASESEKTQSSDAQNIQWGVNQQASENTQEQGSGIKPEDIVITSDLVGSDQDSFVVQPKLQESGETLDITELQKTSSKRQSHGNIYTPVTFKSDGGYRKQFTNADLIGENVSAGGKHKHTEQLVIMKEFQQLLDSLKPQADMRAHVTFPGPLDHYCKPIMECKYCKKSIRNKHDFRRHIVKHPEVDFRPWKCPLCDYRAIVKSTIKKHINVHSELKPYVCLECGRGFNFKQKLHLHMKYHKDIRDLYCPKCSLAFHEIKTLKNHLTNIHDVLNPTDFLKNVNYRVPEERHLSKKNEPESSMYRSLKHSRKAGKFEQTGLVTTSTQNTATIESQVTQEEHVIYFLNSGNSVAVNIPTTHSQEQPNPSNILLTSSISDKLQNVFSVASSQSFATSVVQSNTSGTELISNTEVSKSNVTNQTINSQSEPSMNIPQYGSDIDPTDSHVIYSNSSIPQDPLLTENHILSTSGLMKGMVFTGQFSTNVMTDTALSESHEVFEIVAETDVDQVIADTEVDVEPQQHAIIVGDNGRTYVEDNNMGETSSSGSSDSASLCVPGEGGGEGMEQKTLETLTEWLPSKNTEVNVGTSGGALMLDETTGELVDQVKDKQGEQPVLHMTCVKEEKEDGVHSRQWTPVEITPQPLDTEGIKDTSNQSQSADTQQSKDRILTGDQMTTHFVILNTSIAPKEVDEKTSEVLSPSESKTSKLLGTPKITAQTNRFKRLVPIRPLPNKVDIKEEDKPETEEIRVMYKDKKNRERMLPPKINLKKITDIQKMDPGVRQLVEVIDDPEMPDSKKLVCRLCLSENAEKQTSFRIYSKFIEHLFHEHPSLKPFKCPECGFACRSKANLSSHSKTHAGVKKHVCNICGKGFTFIQKLKVHLRTHSNSREHACDLCSRAFNEKCDLNRHFRKVHMKERKISCRVCNKKYYDVTDLKRHMDSHNEDKNYLCPYCNKYYQTRMSLSQHMKSHTCMFHCEICNKDFGSYSGFMAHKVMHDESADGYWCSQCNKKIATKGSHKRHMKVCHSEVRPFTCNLCNKAFKTKKDFKSHELSHSADKMYVCAVCNFSSSRMDSLKVHMRTHALIKPFQCGVCGKEYTQKAALDQHMILHTEKHKCTVCKKTYPSDYLLYQHMIAVHVPLHLRQQVLNSGSMTVFMCEDCHSVFVSQEDLSQHIMTSHVIDVTPVTEECDAEVDGTVTMVTEIEDSHMEDIEQEGLELEGELSQVECEVVTDDLQVESLVTITSPSPNGQTTKMVSLVHPAPGGSIVPSLHQGSKSLNRKVKGNVEEEFCSTITNEEFEVVVQGEYPVEEFTEETSEQVEMMDVAIEVEDVSRNTLEFQGPGNLPTWEGQEDNEEETQTGLKVKRTLTY